MRCLLVVVWALSIAATAPRDRGPEPRILFDTLTHDFGKVAVGRTVSYRFKFTNHGQAPLAITRVEAA